MSSPAPFASITELLERTLSIRHVYGEPVRNGDTIVIPVARVAYGFGAGGGKAPRRATLNKPGDHDSGENQLIETHGAGGGGGVKLTPVAALEISPQGTRFIRYRPLAPLLVSAAFGIAVGWLLGRRCA